MALNGGPEFKFTQAISMMVNCKTQQEIDTYWKKLSAEGEDVQCGWIKDKFGLSWQITPVVLLGKMLHDKDQKKTDRVIKAVRQMVKLDIKTLERAYAGK